jgi:hypothetical protein
MQSARRYPERREPGRPSRPALHLPSACQSGTSRTAVGRRGDASIPMQYTPITTPGPPISPARGRSAVRGHSCLIGECPAMRVPRHAFQRPDRCQSAGRGRSRGKHEFVDDLRRPRPGPDGGSGWQSPKRRFPRTSVAERASGGNEIISDVAIEGRHLQRAGALWRCAASRRNRRAGHRQLSDLTRQNGPPASRRGCSRLRTITSRGRAAWPR